MTQLELRRTRQNGQEKALVRLAKNFAQKIFISVPTQRGIYLSL